MGTIIAGSSPNLTCTVELSPAVDIPVNVTTMWTGPALDMMTAVTPTSSVMESLTRYIIMAMVDAARGGNYTCQATLSSSSQFITDSGRTSRMTTITVGEYQVMTACIPMLLVSIGLLVRALTVCLIPMALSFVVGPLPPPIILTINSFSPTSITLTWEQREGADAVDIYEINYEYSVNECFGGTFPAVTVMGINGSLRSYTLTNSVSSPVQEDSSFFLTLTAVNSVTRSDPTPPLPNPVMTGDAGNQSCSWLTDVTEA